MVLLGPVGSGKTHALDSIDADMSWGVVRARFDFGDQPEGVTPTTNEVLIRLVFTLSQRWRNRAKPRFPRFAVSLIAIQAELDRTSHDVAKAQLNGLIEDFRAASGEAAMRAVVNRIADGAEAANLLDPSVTALVKDLFPAVISPVRWRLRKAMRSLVDFPQAMGGDVLDALVTLNGLAPVLQTERLLQAFLADVRENHRRMSRPELGSPCKCGDAKRRKHVHNWAILLDDVDEPGGMQFLADLANARGQLAKDVHDPLLVIATSGRWDGAFTGWLPLWKSASDKPALRRLAEVKNADYDWWANADSPYYPVMLDPLRLDEVARILRTGNETPEAMAVWRATQGLPLAVRHLAEHRGDRRLECGADGVVDIYDQSCSTLKALRLPDRLGDFQIEDFVAAAPFATAPWLIPVHADARTTEPRVGAILTELRTSLWVRALPKRVALHPWIATSLVYALNRRGSYVDQFTALRDDPDTGRDPVHLAFVRLALGEVGEVVTYFRQQFDSIPHEAWLDQLRLVVRAPGDLPSSDSCVTLLERIVEQHEGDRTEHTEIRNNIARLVVANWLSANRFSLRDAALDKTSANALRNLASKSRRGDVQALVEAAEQAERGRLIGD